MAVTTFKTWLSGKELFKGINSVNTFSFITDAALLDLQLSLEYGNRTFFDAYKNLTVEQISKIIVAEYKDKWLKLIAVHADNNLNIGSNNSKQNKVVTDYTKDNTGTTNSTNTVSAYNSDTLLDDSGNKGNSSDKEKMNGTVTTTSDEINYNYLFENLKLADQTNIINTVLRDITNKLTLHIYS